MDRIYSERSEENDFMEGTKKRRISSILKAPRTPLRELASENELTQDCDIEKRQKNSRRVSFANTIRVFPSDPQTVVELDHAETAAEARDQDPFNQNEKLEVDLCEITGMNTLLHAPIQTSLQQLEGYKVNTGQEWDKMDKTLIFSEDNEMDMTSGHTIIINHAVGTCQETDGPRKIDFKSFSTELKSNHEATQMNEFSFPKGPTKVNDTCLSQQKTNTENTQKINFDDFLKSLKSAKLFPSPIADIVPSETRERNRCSSNENICSHLQGENCNMATVFRRLNNRQNCVTSILSNEKTTAPPTWCVAEQLGCGEATLACGKESMDMIITNTESVLPPETKSLNMMNQQENLGGKYSVTYDMDSCRLKTSSYQLGIQKDPAMCINEITVNNKETGVNIKHANRDASVACYQGTSTIPMPVTTVPVLHDDKTSFYADMEMTKNYTGLVWDQNSKVIGNFVDGAFEKQRNDVSRLMEGTVSREVHLDITQNQLSTNSFLNHVQCSNSGIAVPNQEVICDNLGLLNSRINAGARTSYLPQRNENAPLASLPSEKAAFFAKNINLNRSQAATSYGNKSGSQFLFLCDDITQQTRTTAVINGNGGLSNNATSFISADKTAVFGSGEDMEITKPITYIVDNSLNTAGFQDMPQQEMRAGQKSATHLDSDKTVVFSLNEDNKMEMTKSCTVVVNYDDMQQCERTPQVLSLQPVDKTVYLNDMDETKVIAGVTDQPVENAGAHAAQNHREIGSAKDRTVIFLLTDENEMEITRSHTVALNHDAVTQGEDIPIASIVSSNKAATLTLSEDMEITNPIACVIDKSLRSITDSLAEPQQNIRTGKKNVTGSACDKTVLFSLSEDNEMKLTKSFSVTVEGAPQVLSKIPAGRTSRSVCSSNMAVTKSTSLVPADETVVFMQNDDMEITKPLSHTINTSLEDTGFKPLPLKKKVIGKVILSGLAKEETVCLLPEDNEMEFTRSHTVTVNSDIIPQVKIATQVLSSAPAHKNSLSACSSDGTITKSTPFVPADKTMMFMCNNDMDITRPISGAFLKNRCFRSLPQTETSKITLSGSVKDSTTVLTLHDNEMEITKCHTVAVNHDIISQSEIIPQVLFHQGNMDITGSYTVTKNPKENLHKNVMKLGVHAEQEPSSDEMVALAMADTEIVKRHTLSFDNRTSLDCLSASQTKPLCHLNKTNAFTFHQDGTEVTGLRPNTVDNGILEGSEKQEMARKNIQQNLGNVAFPTCGEKIQDTEAIRNHTVTTFNPNNYVPDGEKQISKSSTRSKEKTVAFSDPDNMEVNAVKNHYIRSQAKSNSEFPASVVTFGGEIDNDTPKMSICAANVMLPMPMDVVQEQQNSLKTQAKQLGSWTSKTNHFPKEATSNYGNCEDKDFMFPAKMPAPDPTLSEETLDLNRERMCIFISESKSLKDDPRKLFQSIQDGSFVGETDTFPIDKITQKYNTVLCDWGSTAKDKNLDCPSINNSSTEEEPSILPKQSDIISDCSKLKDIGKKSELFQHAQNVGSNFGKELPKLTVKPGDPLGLREDVKKKSSPPIGSNEGTVTGFTEGVTLSLPLNTRFNDSCKIKKIPLGIFPPKLPNKRKSVVSNVADINARSEERIEAQGSQVSLLMKRSSDKVTQNSSPSHYIGEELLPACVDDMDSNESLSCEMPEKLCDRMNEKEIIDKESHLFEIFETNNRQKRALNQEDEDLQQEKKLKVDEGWNATAELKQPLSSTMVAHEGKNVPDVITRNLEKTQSSNSSSLDSIKTDTDFTIQQNSELENQFLMDSICEQNLQEKLQEGTITVREFFTLLQVHFVIQKPRQSLLPPKCAVYAGPTPEDEILSQYIYCPKLQAYDEDCQALCKIIEELKLPAGDQDKLMVNVNKSLWEVMRTCSDEELKGFGAELNKMKSCFTKKSKVLAHRGKAKLYMKLVRNGQLQWEKLQSRLAKVEELLKEMDSCLLALETETAKLEESESDVNDAMAEYKSKLRESERELENCRAQEEALQRDQANVKHQKKNIASEISHLEEHEKRCQELIENYNFSEWVMKEWNDLQAVFTFLYDTIELTLRFGCPVDDSISSNKFCRKIVNVNFESLLDEAKASPSSKLVHRLIFQFINSQSSWQEKCSTVYHLYQMLHDISLVVSRCKLLGEEIDFLNRWGGKSSLLKTEVNDTKVKLLFSSSIAFAKVEVELSLSASYPASPIAFTIQKCIGNVDQEEISLVLSSVPVGANYLKRMVDQIHHNLLQCPSTIHKQQR
ncbi:kinetochore scaffold 1 [Rhineura floridana]|uniref:kinetochore scaffold 1 n=1 Tax=Rhineura floridana TaxID=261503 RepID=UPI002AC82EBC|nr:kinetochore scaffold 1 [Rhineura floridana]XP_061467414.1 kinetochore scaffold 1 [Rhineura floridana]XP_061467415.1 kinetochore scaffold 1 [Rhineura floridana]